MAAIKNFDFDGYANDEPVDPTPAEIENHVTVEGLLILKFGKIKGRAIYRVLTKVANQAAEESGGLPGILFNTAGGEFVGFHPNEYDTDTSYESE